MLSAGLRCFLAVAQSGSMREAANRLHIAQSAISRRIQLLERDLGVQLLERGARGVVLTPAGELLFEHGLEAMMHNERLRAELDALRGLRRGHVVLRAVNSFAASVLPSVISEFHRTYPAVTLDIGVAGSEAVLQEVRERRCHLGIAFNLAPDAEVEVLASAPEPMTAVMSPRHRLAGSSRLSLRDLAGVPLVIPSSLGRSRALFDLACRAAGVELHPVIETNSTHLIAAIVATGEAVAIMAPLVMALHLEVGRVRSIPLAEDELNAGRMVLLTRRGRRLPRAAEELAMLLVREMERKAAKDAVPA